MTPFSVAPSSEGNNTDPVMDEDRMPPNEMNESRSEGVSPEAASEAATDTTSAAAAASGALVAAPAASSTESPTSGVASSESPRTVFLESSKYKIASGSTPAAAASSSTTENATAGNSRSAASGPEPSVAAPAPSETSTSSAVASSLVMLASMSPHPVAVGESVTESTNVEASRTSEAEPGHATVPAGDVANSTSNSPPQEQPDESRPVSQQQQSRDPSPTRSSRRGRKRRQDNDFVYAPLSTTKKQRAQSSPDDPTKQQRLTRKQTSNSQHQSPSLSSGDNEDTSHEPTTQSGAATASVVDVTTEDNKVVATAVSSADVAVATGTITQYTNAVESQAEEGGKEESGGRRKKRMRKAPSFFYDNDYDQMKKDERAVRRLQQEIQTYEQPRTSQLFSEHPTWVVSLVVGGESQLPTLEAHGQQYSAVALHGSVKLEEEPAVEPTFVPLCVDGLFREYQALAAKDLVLPMEFVGYSLPRIQEDIDAKLAELEHEECDLKMPAASSRRGNGAIAAEDDYEQDPFFQQDVRDYRRSLKTLNVLRENERHMRATEKLQDEEESMRFAYFRQMSNRRHGDGGGRGRKNKFNPLQQELAALRWRRIWWVGEKEWRLGSSRKCNLGPNCELCGRHTISNTGQQLAMTATQLPSRPGRSQKMADSSRKQAQAGQRRTRRSGRSNNKRPFDELEQQHSSAWGDQPRNRRSSRSLKLPAAELKARRAAAAAKQPRDKNGHFLKMSAAGLKARRAAAAAASACVVQPRTHLDRSQRMAARSQRMVARSTESSKEKRAATVAEQKSSKSADLSRRASQQPRNESGRFLKLSAAERKRKAEMAQQPRNQGHLETTSSDESQQQEVVASQQTSSGRILPADAKQQQAAALASRITEPAIQRQEVTVGQKPSSQKMPAADEDQPRAAGLRKEWEDATGQQASSSSQKMAATVEDQESTDPGSQLPRSQADTADQQEGDNPRQQPTPNPQKMPATDEEQVAVAVSHKKGNVNQQPPSMDLEQELATLVPASQQPKNRSKSTQAPGAPEEKPRTRSARFRKTLPAGAHEQSRDQNQTSSSEKTAAVGAKQRVAAQQPRNRSGRFLKIPAGSGLKSVGRDSEFMLVPLFRQIRPGDLDEICQKQSGTRVADDALVASLAAQDKKPAARTSRTQHIRERIVLTKQVLRELQQSLRFVQEYNNSSAFT